MRLRIFLVVRTIPKHYGPRCLLQFHKLRFRCKAKAAFEWGLCKAHAIFQSLKAVMNLDNNLEKNQSNKSKLSLFL